MKRRKFIKNILFSLAALTTPAVLSAQEALKKLQTWIIGEDYNPFEHYWGMGIDINKCIGCGKCADACKKENDVPKAPFFFRTWVERYRIFKSGKTFVDSPNGAINGFRKPYYESEDKDKVIRSFFVPKICNHCDNPPCVQVCPVGATFKTPDGVVLVDGDYCIGCRYCIQACPYGARFLHPEKRTAEKCTFCYHRVVKGLVPACVEICPTQTRIFGEIKKKASPLMRFMRKHKIGVLKPSLNTEPKVYYANLDMEVR
ncbi:MAG TPA: 4Fe-4S dicluster domain-containing protein [Caldithrix abyssi]|uniref:4Fe-4S dicluster domain-containing protein n=1 Tax=Caldithrix abyssi TaxID=187145 RepID=A0A7V4UE24_CALAY|nr:4Fe-4S dicluster domain-containing protein [Caldithrix abyssi]